MNLSVLRGGRNEAAPDISDEDLVRAAQAGDEESLSILIRRYESIVRFKAGQYYAPGLDHEDLVQEGMIGLYKAVLNFRQGRAPFRASASVYVDNCLKTAVTAALREKHRPVNEYLPLEREIYDDNEKTYRDAIPDDALHPEEYVLFKETVSEVVRYINRRLTQVERTAVLIDAAREYPIAVQTNGYNYKSLDNARKRARRKLRRAFSRI